MSKRPKGTTSQPSTAASPATDTGISLRIEFVGVIAMACLAIGLIVGSSYFGSGSRSEANDAAYLVAMGNEAYDAGVPKVAILAYQKALEMHGGNPDVLTDLGTMLLQTGRHGEAIIELKAAAAQDPRHVKSRFQLGIALMAGKQYSEAADAFKECLKIDPKSEVAPAARAHLKIVEEKLKKP
jgi:Tfp pilus assembly protein PilF